MRRMLQECVKNTFFMRSGVKQEALVPQSLPPKGFLLGWGQDSVKASELLPHQILQLLCASSHHIPFPHLSTKRVSSGLCANMPEVLLLALMRALPALCVHDGRSTASSQKPLTHDTGSANRCTNTTGSSVCRNQSCILTAGWTVTAWKVQDELVTVVETNIIRKTDFQYY